MKSLKIVGFVCTMVAIGAVAFVASRSEKETANTNDLSNSKLAQDIIQRVALDQTSLADLRQVKLEFMDGSSSEYIVFKDQVATFVEASKQLHYDPDVNPNGKYTGSLKRILTAEARRTGPFWWSTPGLKETSDRTHGAFIFDWIGNSTILWEAPAEKNVKK